MLNVNFEAMEEKYLKILRHYINPNDCKTVIQMLLNLHSVSGSNCCKQCKEPIEKGFRFCSGECKQYYYR